jgi:hypothetical protein
VAEVIREKTRYDLRLERDGHGVYRVVADGGVISTSRVLAAAEIEFDDAVAERSAAAREARARELADFQATGVLRSARAAKEASRNAGRSRGKGG